MAAVVDVFTYNGEAIVAQRLAYLAPVVDRFVIVEARYTHSGTRKHELFIETHRATFAPYVDKIDFVVIEDFPDMPRSWGELSRPWVLANAESWWREGYQRDAALPTLRGLKARFGSMIALVCDSDEIPSREAIQALRNAYGSLETRSAVHLDMAFHYYGFKWTKPEQWRRAFAVTRLDTSLTELRHAEPQHVLLSAGWHCSYFMTPDEMARKISSFAHREVDTADNRDLLLLAKRLEEGTDPLGRRNAPLRLTTPDALADIPPELTRSLDPVDALCQQGQ
ncbi:Beta-1 [Chlorella vulgaris]